MGREKPSLMGPLCNGEESIDILYKPRPCSFAGRQGGIYFLSAQVERERTKCTSEIEENKPAGKRLSEAEEEKEKSISQRREF